MAKIYNPARNSIVNRSSMTTGIIIHRMYWPVEFYGFKSAVQRLAVQSHPANKPTNKNGFQTLRSLDVRSTVGVPPRRTIPRGKHQRDIDRHVVVATVLLSGRRNVRFDLHSRTVMPVRDHVLVFPGQRYVRRVADERQVQRVYETVSFRAANGCAVSVDGVLCKILVRRDTRSCCWDHGQCRGYFQIFLNPAPPENVDRRNVHQWRERRKRPRLSSTLCWWDVYINII